MGRRRRNKRPAITFFTVLEDAPSSGGNKLVFPYDFELKDYNLSIFDSMTFQGALSKAELLQVRRGLKKCTTWYKISKYGYMAPNITFAVCCFVGWLAVIIGNLIGSSVDDIRTICGHLAALACFVFGILFYFIADCVYASKLREREKDIREYLVEEINPQWRARGMKWTVSNYAAYLRLTYSEEILMGSKDFRGINQVGGMGNYYRGGGGDSSVRRPMLEDDTVIGVPWSGPAPMQYGGVAPAPPRQLVEADPRGPRQPVVPPTVSGPQRRGGPRRRGSLTSEPGSERML